MRELKATVQLGVCGGMLRFHAIGFGEDAKVWLKKMAASVAGNYHKCVLFPSSLDFGLCSWCFLEGVSNLVQYYCVHMFNMLLHTD